MRSRGIPWEARTGFRGVKVGGRDKDWRLGLLAWKKTTNWWNSVGTRWNSRELAGTPTRGSFGHVENLEFVEQRVKWDLAVLQTNHSRHGCCSGTAVDT